MKSGVHVRLSTEMTQVVKWDKDGVVVSFVKRTPVPENHNPVNNATDGPDNHNPSNGNFNAEEWEEDYDELILCVL